MSNMQTLALIALLAISYYIWRNFGENLLSPRPVDELVPLTIVVSAFCAAGWTGLFFWLPASAWVAVLICIAGFLAMGRLVLKSVGLIAGW